MPTAHNSAKKGEIAKTVLMPGDPLRAKFIAETFLENAELVNNVRGIQGYTGTYQGVPVSGMASGMGIPSMGIYSYELFHFYDVDHIIRVGTAGAIHPDLKLRDVVAGMAACTNSSFVKQYNLPGDYAPIASYRMLRAAEEAEKKAAPYLAKVSEIQRYNQEKMQAAFMNAGVSESHFVATTGYGYGDRGRDALDEVYAQFFEELGYAIDVLNEYKGQLCQISEE